MGTSLIHLLLFLTAAVLSPTLNQFSFFSAFFAGEANWSAARSLAWDQRFDWKYFRTVFTSYINCVCSSQGKKILQCFSPRYGVTSCSQGWIQLSYISSVLAFIFPALVIGFCTGVNVWTPHFSGTEWSVKKWGSLNLLMSQEITLTQKSKSSLLKRKNE